MLASRHRTLVNDQMISAEDTYVLCSFDKKHNHPSDSCLLDGKFLTVVTVIIKRFPDSFLLHCVVSNAVNILFLLVMLICCHLASGENKENSSYCLDVPLNSPSCHSKKCKLISKDREKKVLIFDLEDRILAKVGR